MTYTTAEKLYYFRTAPFPVKQPNNANRRTDRGENLLSIELANYLRQCTLTGRCTATWTKIAHETSSKSHSFGNLMRNMGKLAGVPDFIFTGAALPGGVLWLELKNGNHAAISPSQKFFQTWCAETGSPYAIAYSVPQAIKLLEGAGITHWS